MQHGRQKGQVVILVLVALSIFILGALGLAVDGSHLFAQRQMAQAAADSAAQAAAMSVLGGTNTAVPYDNEYGASSFTCTNGTDVRTPCLYARLSGFGEAGSTDVVDVSFPGSSAAPGVIVSSAFNPNLITVQIRRTVNSGMMRLLSSTNANVKVLATAALTHQPVPVPILVLHPTRCESFRRGGAGNVRICGGPEQSIQVNSSCVSAVDDDGGGGAVDLSKAGPADPGDCTLGTGTVFGHFGGPASYPGTILLGSTGVYEGRAPITDPYKDVFPANNVPIPGGPAPPPTAPLAPGVSGCPAVPVEACKLYSPGYYPTGIQVKKETAVFKPGLYYMGSGGFEGQSNSVMLMATGFGPDTTAGTATGAGMVVYNSGPVVAGVANAGKFEVGSQGAAALRGSDKGSVWKGILLFQDRRSVAHQGSCCGHKLGGGGDLTMLGSIYLTNGPFTTAARWQELILRGNAGNTTNVEGDIDVDTLDSGGGGTITMKLDPDAVFIITKVALVQ